jgi:predicted metalloprotease with PDZ domain
LTAAAVAKEPPLQLEVDAGEAARKLFHARLVIPAAPGGMTLYYPKWVPGEHGPTGPVTDLAGLKIRAAGAAVPWTRDDVDVYAIHCRVPDGAGAVEVSLDLLASPLTSGYSAGATTTPRVGVINWNQFLLYPAGRSVRDIECRASLVLPDGWKLGTALPVAEQSGQRTTFKPVSLETLVDSPVLCGVHFRDLPLGNGKGVPHVLHLACDSAAGLEISDELKAKYDRLITEAEALFGARHYESYHFLLALSDNLPHFGLEHHQSSDNRGPERLLLDDGPRTAFADLLPHEYVHSWNGKYRRPADMVTADFQQAQRTRLLWVYEGLTQYLGFVLAARSGLLTPEQARDYLAGTAARMTDQRGRSWRPLEDTAAAAQLLYGARRDWASWRRGVDFYDEGVLIWLEVDMLIRARTDGKRSLDDFCRRFHGGSSGPAEVKPYTFDDVVAALRATAEYDWKTMLTRRVAVTEKDAPLEGIRQAGWKLGYGDRPGPVLKAWDAINKTIDLSAGPGLVLNRDGTVADVVPGKAADRGGIAPGMKLVAVNTRRWTEEVLRTAVASTGKGQGLELLMENGDFFRTYKLDYSGGEKYPRLERLDAGTEDRLLPLLTPQRPGGDLPPPG